MKKCRNCGSIGANIGCDTCGNPLRERKALDPSAFWSCVAGSVAIIIETLPRCGSSSLFQESKSMRESLARLVGIMERGEIIEIRTAETLEEMEARDLRDHVCGSESQND